ncbi:MAG TPA: hypothetical protein PKH94_01945 [Bacteroidales bacterium]|nr:hypothetical protein [Bacteroidales bacterium]HNS45981.1 hypothetical protein [Bacteroidales bacterium]
MKKLVKPTLVAVMTLMATHIFVQEWIKNTAGSLAGGGRRMEEMEGRGH